MLDFLLAITFSVFLFLAVHPSHGLPVLVLDKQILNPSLGSGIRNIVLVQVQSLI